ncbi:pickpocket protein 28 isoform X1 [Nomia melanderi]|uniref:pickpocket protein 28 isoform X1 n=1 Tax=Nomia melanderi TaxID=2448451 RepID=UPI003FCD8EAE
MKTLPRHDYNSPKKMGKPGGKLGRLSGMQTLKRAFRVYFENTGLHGFRYIITGRTSFDRNVWFAICVAAIVFCLILMLRLWEHFSNNPTVTIIDTSNPIKDLQFPGITICNNNKVYKEHADLIAQKLLINGFDISMTNKLFSSLMKLIRPDKIEIDNATASWVLDTLGYSVEKLMFELMQPCSSLLVRCAWLGQLYNCNKIFKTVKSNEGFCCGFNYHYDLSKNYEDSDSWLTNITATEEEPDSDSSSQFLPGIGDILRVPGTGRDIGLSVALNIDAANYKSSIRQYVGANVLVHDSIDYPDVGAQTSSLIPGQVMTLTLSGTRVRSSRDIRNIPLSKRMCLFDGESPGERKYSYQTCISECIQKNTYSPCGCLPFFFPDEHPETRTCYLTDVDCILTHRRRLSEVPLSHINDCNCLPQCNDETYDAFSESIQLSDIGYDSEITHGLNIKNISFLYVYFRDGSYLEYRKDTILGWDSLLASFGGIFGLCLGGSVISFIEFLYYLTSELLAARKEKRELRNENLPPASKLFTPGPVNKDPRKADKCVFYVWNEQFPRQNQKSTFGFRNDGLRPYRE